MGRLCGSFVLYDCRWFFNSGFSCWFLGVNLLSREGNSQEGHRMLTTFICQLETDESKGVIGFPFVQGLALPLGRSSV